MSPVSAPGGGITAVRAPAIQALLLLLLCVRPQVREPDGVADRFTYNRAFLLLAESDSSVLGWTLEVRGEIPP